MQFTQFLRALNERVTLIAIDGGPCGGKTTFMAKAKQYLESHGYFVGVLSERATEFILAGVTPWSAWDDPLDFQRFLLFQGLNMESVYAEMLVHIAGNKPVVLLCDRGTKGFGAYVSREEAHRVMESLQINDQFLRDRYKAVIHLVTAADGAEEFYTLDNNPARTEKKLEEARELDRKTVTAWLGHPHLIIIDNRTSFDQKIKRGLTAFARVLGMPEPLEKERKFLVTNFRQELIPPQSVLVEIEQTYLLSPPGVERRIREWTVNNTNATSYFYTEKSPTGETGVRVERERTITLREYEVFLREMDPETRTIIKDRYCFSQHGHNFELDVYPDSPDATIEVEVEDMSLEITPPTGFEWIEVTGNKKYSNRELARIQK